MNTVERPEDYFHEQLQGIPQECPPGNDCPDARNGDKQKELPRR
jgi:hypothetical protein